MWQKEKQIVSRKRFRTQGPALQIPTQAALVGTGGSARCRKLRKLHRLEHGAIHRNLRSRLQGHFTFKLNFPTEIKPILWKKKFIFGFAITRAAMHPSYFIAWSTSTNCVRHPPFPWPSHTSPPVGSISSPSAGFLVSSFNLFCMLTKKAISLSTGPWLGQLDKPLTKQSNNSYLPREVPYFL